MIAAMPAGRCMDRRRCRLLGSGAGMNRRLSFSVMRCFAVMCFAAATTNGNFLCALESFDLRLRWILVADFACLGPAILEDRNVLQVVDTDGRADETFGCMSGILRGISSSNS